MPLGLYPLALAAGRSTPSACASSTVTVATSRAATGEGSEMIMKKQPAIKEVVFKVSRPDGQYGLHKLADTVFKLGMGPCGRWVENLEVGATGDLLRIKQTSLPFDISEARREHWESKRACFGYREGYAYVKPALIPADILEYHKERLNVIGKLIKEAEDGREIKEFIYKMADIHGRIVTTS